ncbi:MAG: N-acetylmuramoyl-L-alanine amidase family protein [Anaerolineae bacterium]
MSSTILPRETHVQSTRAPKATMLKAVATQIKLTPVATKELTPNEVSQESGLGQDDPPSSQSIPSELTIYGAGKHLVAIDVGHGGIDEGTYPIDDHGPIDYTESQINLAVALRLRDILVANGIRVYLNRIGDYYLNPELLDINGDGLVDPGDEQQARVDLVNASVAELLLSLHQNASTYDDGSINPNRNGSTTYYCDARPFSDLSYRFATLVHQEVLDGLAAYGYESYDLGVLDDLEIDDYEPKLHLILLGPQTDRIARPSNMPAALDEPLFATNVIEARMLPLAEVQDVLAQAYARAIIRYFAELDGG